MFCGKCGNPMEDDALFCPNCGAAAGNEESTPAPVEETECCAETEEMIPSEELEQEYTQPETPAFDLNTEGEVSKPKKKVSKLPILIAAIVAVAAVALVAVLNWDNFTGFFERTFSSPEKLQANVFEDTVIQMFDNVTGDKEEKNNIDPSNCGAEGEVRVTIDQQILDMIPAQGMDLSFLSDIAIGYDVSRKDALTKMVLDVILGDTTLVSANAILNSETMEMYAGVPELNDKALYVNMKEMLEENMGYSVMSGVDPEMMEMVSKVMPSEETLRTIIARYVNLVMSGFGEVEKSNEKMKIAGISQKLHVLKATMDEDDLLKIAKNLLKTLKKDKDIEDIIVNMEEVVGEEGMYDSFVEAMEEALAALDEVDSDDMPSFKVTLITYLNNANEIVGITAKVSIDKGAKLEPFSWIRVEQGKKFASELVISTGTQAIVFEGSGEKGDSTNSEYVLSFDGEEILTVNVSDYVNNDEQVSGTIRIAPSDEILDNIMSNMNDAVSGLLGSADPGLEITFFNTKESIKLEVGLAAGSKKLLSISTSATLTAPDTITVPEDYVEISEDTDPSQWLETMNPDFLETLMDRLIEAGVPAELFVMG